MNLTKLFKYSCNIGILVPEMNKLLQKFLAKFVEVVKQHTYDSIQILYQIEANHHLLVIGTSAEHFLDSAKDDTTTVKKKELYFMLFELFMFVVNKIIQISF